MMDPSLLLDGLNDRQRDAVALPLGHCLVLAGAGSGKTRVLVHRIAWLMAVEGASPFSIMSVTFTNKAAAEMRKRIEDLIKTSGHGMWNGTFHGICHRMLRSHYLDAKLPQDFQVLDSEDQKRLLKRLIKAQNLDEKQWPASQVAWWINQQKDQGLRPENINHYGNPIEQTYQQLYQIYQEACDRAGLVDFAEILLRTVELLRNNIHIQTHYQQRFQHILVDEFQDTNQVQYAWLCLMAGKQSHVMIVGDDDQSIYGWRGANVKNIEKFTQQFPKVTTIRLEQNYRSTQRILDAANALIAHNEDRLGKSLWTQGDAGDPILVYAAFSDLDEASFVANKIVLWQESGGNLNDCAILYRSNAQSRLLENALLQHQLPYRIYGGMRFFERQEVKDVLGYLRLIANPWDDTAFERVVNRPTRGIGERSLETLRITARDRGCSLWEAGVYLLSEKVLVGRAGVSLQRFIELITAFADEKESLSLMELTKSVIQASGLKEMYLAEKGEKAQARIDNLEELVTAAQQFMPTEEEADMPLLTAFLSRAALEAGDGQADEYTDAVQLMTLHSAKGLEFPQVFMVGMEQNTFPNYRVINEGNLSEERRLCYVGMTRAMQNLTLSYAEKRWLYGKEQYFLPSCFLKELPDSCLQEVRLKTQIHSSAQAKSSSQATKIKEAQATNETGFRLGQRVRHATFGEGTIINCEGAGEQSRVQVAFNGAGIKWLVTQFAKLEAVTH